MVTMMPSQTKIKTKRKIKSLIGFPKDLQLAIQGIQDTTRQQILLILDANKALSFSDIQKRMAQQMRIAKNTLAHHLKVLIRSLLVEHYYEHKVGVEQFSFYRISPFGHRVVLNLYQALKSSAKMI